MEDREGLRRAKKKSEWRKNEDWGGRRTRERREKKGRVKGQDIKLHGAHQSLLALSLPFH